MPSTSQAVSSVHKEAVLNGFGDDSVSLPPPNYAWDCFVCLFVCSKALKPGLDETDLLVIKIQ